MRQLYSALQNIIVEIVVEPAPSYQGKIHCPLD
jgi:hypothetical protein